MKPRSLSLFLMLTACSADVDLDLTPHGPPGVGGDPDTEAPDTESPPDSPAVAGWSLTDLADTQVERVGWAPGGDLLVSDLGYEDRASGQAATSSLRRFDPGGAPRWTSELPTRDGGGTYTAFAAATDGTVVTGVTFAPYGRDDDSAAPPAELRWLDADGATTASVALTAAATGLPGDVVMVNSVVALPDGGVALAGVSGTVTGPALVARLDAAAEVMWSVPIEWWSPDTLGDNSPHGVNAANNLTLTADGGLILGGRYFADVTVGDRSASNPVGFEVAGAVYVTRIEPDGVVSWLQSIHDQDYAVTGHTAGLALTADGHIMVAGAVDGRARVGDLELEDQGNGGHYAAELDGDGQPVSLVELQVPESVEWGFTGQTMVTRGAQLLLVGQETTMLPVSQEPSSIGARILLVAYGADGAVESTLSVEAEGRLTDASGFVSSAAVSPDGRLAFGGTYAGWADFGQGPVSSPEAQEDLWPYQPSGYIAVFDPPAAVD